MSEGYEKFDSPTIQQIKRSIRVIWIKVRRFDYVNQRMICLDYSDSAGAKNSVHSANITNTIGLRLKEDRVTETERTKYLELVFTL